MKPDLTDKQQRFLDYLNRRVEHTGSIPSLRRAAADLGVSHTAVSQMLKILEGKGLVRRDGPYSRNVYLLNRFREAAGAMRWLEVPVIGRIAAGLPLYAQQQWEESVVVDTAVYRGTGLFALRVRGDSMRDAAILDGDLVICEPRQYAQ
ncbi:MAG: LexA family transcriptional regulator, partial [Deltaproteobacteria bacterium SG8_13]